MSGKVMEVLSTRQDGEKFDGRIFHHVQANAMRSVLEKLVERESRPSQVGPRVSALRETLGLSKAQFADSIGLDRSSLTKIERGEVGLDIAVGERIAVMYGYGLDFIYRGELADVPQDSRPQLMVNLLTARHPL